MRLSRIATMLALTTAVAACLETGAAGTSDVLAGNSDPRLEQKISFSTDGSRVLEVLAKLSESTGVGMIAGADDNDWMVYDRKVIIHVADIKLIELMRALSSVLRFEWSRTGEEGKWAYQLQQSKEQHAEEQSLRAAADDAQARQFREKRENVIADLVNLSSLSEKDASALKTTEPWRYVLATEPLGRDVAEFINSFPEARNALVQGTEATFAVSSLSPNLQETVRRIAFSYDSLIHGIGASENHSELLSRFDKLQITINRRRLSGAQDALSRAILGRITIGGEDDSFDIPVLDPSSRVARALGTAIVALKSGVSKEDVAKQLQSELAEVAKSSTTGDTPARDIASDPALRRKIRLFAQPTSATLPVVLKALAEKTGLNVVSDYFPSLPVSMDAQERTLGEHLETIRESFGSNWEKSGRLILLRDKEWFRKRTWEVPQVWIDYWTKRGELNDGLQFADLVQIANLRDEQIDHAIMLTPSLVAMGAGANLGPADGGRNRWILRFYALLTDEQRTALATRGLEVTSLSDAQWEALRKALAATGSAYAAASRGSQTIDLTQSGSGGADYIFSYHPGDGEHPVTFRLTTGTVYKTSDEIVLPKKKIVVPAPSP
ncbi:MAG: hypothetical protein ACP5R5_00505 [Armatimonadota bacterium]